MEINGPSLLLSGLWWGWELLRGQINRIDLYMGIKVQILSLEHLHSCVSFCSHPSVFLWSLLTDAQQPDHAIFSGRVLSMWWLCVKYSPACEQEQLSVLSQWPEGQRWTLRCDCILPHHGRRMESLCVGVRVCSSAASLACNQVE